MIKEDGTKKMYHRHMMNYIVILFNIGIDMHNEAME